MDQNLKEKMSLRRLRQNPAIRELTKEVRISHQQFIQPLFAAEGIRSRESIPGLTGVYRETTETLIRQVESDLENGTNKFLLFGVPSSKAANHFDFSYTSSQITELKKRFKDDIFLSVDVCLCSSTTHGHCGVLTAEGNHVDNAASVDELARAALEYAQAGADCVAPSDMMDGRIAAIRRRLDEVSLDQKLIMSYSAKFNSRFYGPFRVAADSAPKGGGLKDRATYQIDPARPGDALASSLRDAAEGADILMVKPGLVYLDILSDLSKQIAKPWAVYEVSGEFAAIELMAQQNLIDATRGHVECWTALIRAGASMIISYGARNARRWLNEV